MTKDEAIEIINRYDVNFCDDEGREIPAGTLAEAFDMAVKALKETAYEKVNHPAHYNLPGKKECIKQMEEDYGEYITMIFCLTSAYKYLYRAGEKPGESEE